MLYLRKMLAILWFSRSEIYRRYDYSVLVLRESLRFLGRFIWGFYIFCPIPTPFTHYYFTCIYSSTWNIFFYYMANPVLGKSLCSDWFFLGQDFAVRTVSMETVQPLYFCFGAKPAISKFATKTANKDCEYCHSSQ